MNTIQEHCTLFLEIREFFLGKKKSVSGIVYAPLTVGLRAVYVAAYVAAYVVSPRRPASYFSPANDIEFVFGKSFATRLPVSFLENPHKNRSRLFCSFGFTELAHYGC